MPEISDSARLNGLSATLVVPDAKRRRSLAAILSGLQVSIAREFADYPSRPELAEIGPLDCLVVIVDFDDDVEQAIRVIESISSHNPLITVMACSRGNDANLMRRSMQAGAREFLTEPLLPETVREAFSLAAARRFGPKKAPGKTLVFFPAKGGIGVTTIAGNFALTLARESGAKVVVVDLDFELGEIALGLGLTAQFSVMDALLNPARLDKEFLATLLLKHNSGLTVLASQDEYHVSHCPEEGAAKLFTILQEEFDYVVVDAGTCHGQTQDALFEVAHTIYLITEMSFPAVRNAHRLISFLSAKDKSRSVQVVLNRFNSNRGDIDEESTVKALSRPISWRIPNGYAAVRAAEDSGVPLAMSDSSITRALAQMAKAACGKPYNVEEKTRKGFRLFPLRAVSAPPVT